jgi:hypothetical protein
LIGGPRQTSAPGFPVAAGSCHSRTGAPWPASSPARTASRAVMAPASSGDASRGIRNVKTVKNSGSGDQNSIVAAFPRPGSRRRQAAGLSVLGNGSWVEAQFVSGLRAAAPRACPGRRFDGVRAVSALARDDGCLAGVADAGPTRPTTASSHAEAPAITQREVDLARPKCCAATTLLTPVNCRLGPTPPPMPVTSALGG